MSSVIGFESTLLISKLEMILISILLKINLVIRPGVIFEGYGFKLHHPSSQPIWSARVKYGVLALATPLTRPALPRSKSEKEL